MQVEPSYVTLAVGLLLAAIGWLTKVHYDLIQLKKEARESLKQVALGKAANDLDASKLRSEIATVRAEAQAQVGTLEKTLTRLELRIETAVTSIVEQMKQLFRDQDKH